MKTLKELLFLIAGIVLFISCSKSDPYIGDDLNGLTLNEITQNRLVVHEGTLNLQGYTRFAFSAPKEGVVITDGYNVNFLECTAELTFLDGQNFVLNTEEVVPDINLLYRKISFHGKMSPSGELKFTWPETWWELGTVRGNILGQVREHTGMNISGQGINNNTLNYMGYLKEGKFFADMHITGLQQVPGTMPFFAEIVEGPVMINFMIDLEVVE